MSREDEALPLNSVRAFVMIAREKSVTRAARALGTTQSSANRHLAVLESYLGAQLIERRGRYTELTEFGRLFANAVSEPLDSVFFTAQRMRRQDRAEANRIVVRTSLSHLRLHVAHPQSAGVLQRDGWRGSGCDQLAVAALND